MPNSDLRNLFGMTEAIVYARSLPKSAYTTRLMCESVAQGFGLSTTDGSSIYSYYRTEGQPESTNAIFDTPYTTYEAQVQGVIDGDLPSVAQSHRELLTVAAHAMIFAYTLNPVITVSEFQTLIGRVLSNISTTVIGTQVFDITDNVITTPFSNTTTLNSLLANNYSPVIQMLGIEPKTIEVDLTNYNWYDTTDIFRGPNLTIMKDVENQYYYVSGKMIYEGALGALEPCIEDNVTINTWSGSANFSYVRNLPCRKSNGYVGPLNNVDFYRVFNDGPASSGYYKGSVSGFYMDNDRAVLNPHQYQSNAKNLFTYTGSALSSSVFVDANGAYALLEGDYANAPYSWNCSVPLQRMHIGDNRARHICTTSPCSCTLQTKTGFKYVSIDLPDSLEVSGLQFRQTNPLSTIPELRRRSWSIEENPYWATDVGGILYPYIQDVSPPFKQYWTVGYPVLNGKSTLPQLAFFQTFDNPTFGDVPSLAMFPSLSTAAANNQDGADASRSYSTDVNNMLFSGQSSLPLKFNQVISSNLSGKNWISQKFFGMGTAFSGRYNIISNAEENAGFTYTGFTVYESGVAINANTLANNFSNSIIGGKYPIIKYISGYKRISDNALFGLTNKYAKDSSGNLYVYSYFDQTELPMITLQEDNWSYFAPTPTDFENTSIYERVYAEQDVENYFPRYYDGPFSVEQRVFLYPNAQASDALYEGKENGIPTRIRFKVKIREEVVKELSEQYIIYPDGLISAPTPVNVVRPDVIGNRTRNPKMFNIFHPDNDADTFDYNFNFWPSTGAFNYSASIGEWVDNNWAPKTSGLYVPSGRNSVVYDANVDAASLFRMGVKKTFEGHQTHIAIGPGGSYRFFYTPKPVNDGLFHAFDYSELSGLLIYTLPLFDLTQNSMSVTQNMLEAFPEILNSLAANVCHSDGFQDSARTGMDPLFYEYMGGRRGRTAEQEGGYHSKGIIGDRWVGSVYQNFGTTYYQCWPLGYDDPINVPFRYPGSDAKLSLFNTDVSGTDVWVNGMSYAPYRTHRNTGRLKVTDTFNYQTDNDSGQIIVSSSGEFITFDLGVFFNLKSRTGTIADTQWYYNSGLRIGPFDKDVEVGLTDGSQIVAYTDLYINNEQLSHYAIEESVCDRNYVTNIGRGRIIKTNEPSFTFPRGNGYTILAVIPSGEQGNFNVWSNPVESGGGQADVFLGISGNAILTLKTHQSLDANDYDDLLHSGEQTWLYPNGFVNNGLQQKYRLNHDGPAGFGGLFEFTNYGYSGKLYPKPNESEFAKYATTDAFSNVIYTADKTPQSYWRQYAIKNNTQIKFSGYREGSRISFEITDVSVDYDVPPYQNYTLVVPSGTCRLSGEMGYYAQADNSIFSEGLYLINTTPNDDFASTYNPSYLSDVLIGMSTGIFITPTTPSGSGHMPVLKAPSVMKQRVNRSGISVDQQYVPLLTAPPQNYNKLMWPALSDLETLNAGETIESIPPGDGNTFTNSTMMFSACQGQSLPNGLANPIITKRYAVQNIFQTYDSVATDSTLNPQALTSGRGTKVELNQSQLSGALVPRGTPLTLIIRGLV